MQSVFFKKFTDGLLLQSITKRDGLLQSATSVALGKCVYLTVKICLREHFYTWARLADFGKTALNKRNHSGICQRLSANLADLMFLVQTMENFFNRTHDRDIFLPSSKRAVLNKSKH